MQAALLTPQPSNHKCLFAFRRQCPSRRYPSLVDRSSSFDCLAPPNCNWHQDVWFEQCAQTVELVHHSGRQSAASQCPSLCVASRGQTGGRHAAVIAAATSRAAGSVLCALGCGTTCRWWGSPMSFAPHAGHAPSARIATMKAGYIFLELRSVDSGKCTTIWPLRAPGHHFIYSFFVKPPSTAS